MAQDDRTVWTLSTEHLPILKELEWLATSHIFMGYSKGLLTHG